MSPGRPILLVLLASLASCAPAPVAPQEAVEPLAGVHLFVSRPFTTTPEPDPFIAAAIVAWTEEVVRSGYDYMGRTLDPEDEEARLETLGRLNLRRPGTAGVYLVFIEAPSLVGFGPAYTQVHCTVYGPSGRVLLATVLESPERRSLVDMVLPRRQPDIEGRYWAAKVWKDIAKVLPPRVRE